jgi:hypothetical protein
LCQVLEEPAMRSRLSVAGLARSQDFSWDSVCARYEAVYRGSATVVAA